MSAPYFGDVMVDGAAPLWIVRHKSLWDHGLVYHEEHGPLFSLQLTPGFRNACPSFTLEKFLICSMDHPPDYEPHCAIRDDDNADNAGGMYCLELDRVWLINRKAMQGTEIAETLAHELAHCTGHIRRLARFEETPQKNAEPPVEAAQILLATAFRAEPPKYDTEEHIAEVASSMVCVQLGIDPTSTASPRHWLRGWGWMSPDQILDVARQAQQAAQFLLRTDEPLIWE